MMPVKSGPSMIMFFRPAFSISGARGTMPAYSFWQASSRLGKHIFKHIFIIEHAIATAGEGDCVNFVLILHRRNDILSDLRREKISALSSRIRPASMVSAL